MKLKLCYILENMTKIDYFHLWQFLADHCVPCHRKAWIIPLKKRPKPRISSLCGWTASIHRLVSHFWSNVFIRSAERRSPWLECKVRNSSGWEVELQPEMSLLSLFSAFSQVQNIGNFVLTCNQGLFWFYDT